MLPRGMAAASTATGGLLCERIFVVVEQSTSARMPSLSPASHAALIETRTDDDRNMFTSDGRPRTFALGTAAQVPIEGVRGRLLALLCFPPPRARRLWTGTIPDYLVIFLRSCGYQESHCSVPSCLLVGTLFRCSMTDTGLGWNFR